MALTGKNGLVTGAASGFGRTTAHHLTGRGANVVAFLADDERADLITGVDLNIEDGRGI